jgi:hypothetical protein
VPGTTGTKSATYCYDANGNMTSGDGRTTTWSAFNMPTSIVKGTSTVAFQYGPDRGRFKRVDTTSGGQTTCENGQNGLKWRRVMRRAPR